MLAVICALVFGAYALRGQVQRILSQLPDAASQLSAGLAKMRSDQSSNMKNMQTAANTIEKVSKQADMSELPWQRSTHIVVDQPSFRLSNFVWVGSRGAFAIFGEASIVFFGFIFLAQRRHF